MDQTRDALERRNPCTNYHLTDQATSQLYMLVETMLAEPLSDALAEFELQEQRIHDMLELPVRKLLRPRIVLTPPEVWRHPDGILRQKVVEVASVSSETVVLLASVVVVVTLRLISGLLGLSLSRYKNC